MIVMRANFQFEFHRDVEVTHARALEKRRLFFARIFHLSSNLIDQKWPLQHPIECDGTLHEMYPFSAQRRTRVYSHTIATFRTI